LEFRLYLELFEEIALMQGGLRKLSETKIEDGKDHRLRADVRDKQTMIDKLYEANKESLDIS